MASPRASLRILGYSLAIATGIELILGSAFAFIGLSSSGYGVGDLLWDLHTPGRIVLCQGLRLCGGYDHFVFGDSFVIGETLYPDRGDLVLLGFVNAVLIGLAVFLLWTLVLSRRRRGGMDKGRGLTSA